LIARYQKDIGYIGVKYRTREGMKKHFQLTRDLGYSFEEADEEHYLEHPYAFETPEEFKIRTGLEIEEPTDNEAKFCLTELVEDRLCSSSTTIDIFGHIQPADEKKYTEFYENDPLCQKHKDFLEERVLNWCKYAHRRWLVGYNQIMISWYNYSNRVLYWDLERLGFERADMNRLAYILLKIVCEKFKRMSVEVDDDSKLSASSVPKYTRRKLSIPLKLQEFGTALLKIWTGYFTRFSPVRKEP
jgi:hypothetical protein